MAITKVIGSFAVVTIDTVAVPLVKSAEFSISQSEVDVTDNDNTGAWNSFLMGNRTGTFSLTFNWDSALTGTDAEPQEVFPVNLAGTNAALAIVYYPNGDDVGSRRYSFSAKPMEFTHGISNETVVECSVTFRVTGAITVDVVPSP